MEEKQNSISGRAEGRQICGGNIGDEFERRKTGFFLGRKMRRKMLSSEENQTTGLHATHSRLKIQQKRVKVINLDICGV